MAIITDTSGINHGTSTPLGLGANNLTMTGSISTTGSRVTKGWFTDIESTNAPTVGGTAVLVSGGALGTPSSGTATNLTGTATGLTVGITNGLKSATTTVDVSAATAPSSGQVLTATSSTAATWQTPSSASGASISISSYFETSARFDTTLGGTGTGTIGGNYGARMNTGATSNSFVAILAKMNDKANFQIYNGSPSASTVIGFTSIGPSANTGQMYWGIGNLTDSGTALDFTANHIGFKLLTTGTTQYSLYATQSGGTETASSALTTIAQDDVISLYFKVNGTSSVDYYWSKNGGAWSSATNLTTNMPTSTTTEETMQWIINNQNTANGNRVEVSAFEYKR